MANINVILQAKARGGNVHKWLRESTKLADGFAASAERASAAMSGMGRGTLGSIAASGGGRQSRGRVPRVDGGGRAEAGAARAKERAVTTEARGIERQIAAEARVNQRRLRASTRAAKTIENLSEAQLKEREIQREINARRTRAARASAKTSLGADPTGRKMGAFGKFELAENLAVAGGEFTNFSSKVEEGTRDAFQKYKDYQKSVAEVSTLTANISVDQITSITSAAASEFGGLPTDQVKGFYAIVSAGATNAADAQAQLTAANKLAIGGVATQEEAVLAISKSVANFGVTSEQAADSLFVAVKRGQTTVEELARALPNVASSAAGAGLSIDETNAALAVLSTRLPNAKEAATSLKAAFSNLQKPTKGARAEAEKLGIDFSVAGVKAAGGIEEFLLKLRAAEGFDENTLAKLFDSSEARSAISNLIDGMGEYRSVLSDMETKQGAADTAYAKMADTSAQKSKVLEAQLELLKIQAGEALVPALMSLAKQVMPIIQGLREWIKENPNAASTLANLTIAVIAGGKAIGILTSAYSMWSTVSGLAQIKNDALTKSIGGGAGQIAKASKAAAGLQTVIGSLPTIFAGAGVAIAGFTMLLDHASEPLNKYEAKLGELEERQNNIAFQTSETKEQTDHIAYLEQQLAQATESSSQQKGIEDALKQARKDGTSQDKIDYLEQQLAQSKKAGTQAQSLQSELDSAREGAAPRDKTMREIRMDQRNRLIEQVQAARTLASEGRGSGAKAALMGGDILGGYGQGITGLFNQATGVQDTFDQQQAQAEMDLARFDETYGRSLGLGDAAFKTDATSSGLFDQAGTLAALQELVAATQAVAANTAPSAGPSMEAGMV